jgi:tetratricopeptide (TPR) repeat protein
MSEEDKMKYLYNIKMRAVSWAALGMVCIAATLGTSSVWAQSGCFIDNNGNRACPVGPDPGGGSGNTSSMPSGPSPEEVRQQRERQRLKAKEWSSDEALDYFDRKDWNNAIRSFEEALDHDPDDPDLNNWLKRAKAEKAKAQMPAVAAPSRPAPNNDSKVVDTRNEPADLGGKSKLKGTLATPKPAPPTDTSVVGARNVPSGLPKSVDDAIPHTPSGDRVRKGFQAIQAGDWKAALAWFQDARNREPGNPGLGRLVDLARFTLDYRTRAQTPSAKKNSTPVRSAQLPKQNSTTNSTDGAVAKSGDPVVEPGDGTLARTSARQMAARARADAAFKEYTKKYGGHDVMARTRAVSKAYRGEGYTDEELKVQLQKSLLDYRKNYRKNHPNGPNDSVGGSPAAEEITLGGKG